MAEPSQGGNPQSPEALRQETSPAWSGPVILFDGVCNLCHAAVQWVIARDRKARFRFASLQSQAARAAIAAAPAGAALGAGRPDSVILLDGDGLHVRSDAALRIAKTLGFPWSLAGLGAILPRALRDGLYDWIARNRYRWFGRQNACLLPTPELRARFLDADEPPALVPAASEAALSAPPAAPTPRGLWAHVRTFGIRFFLAYLVFQALPFPCGLVPYTGKVAEWYGLGMTQLVTWVAAWLGLTVSAEPTGSGDTTFNYVELGVLAVLALLAALVWTLVRRGGPVSARTRDGLRTYIGLNLATVLLIYGWDKVIPLQMPAPGPDRLLIPIGDTSPMGLLWTFMGASPAYQIFGGLGEVTAGLLLLWRRTTLLGSLVAVAVMTNVVALNFCYDVPVKLYSSHLLLMALYLAAPHVSRLASILFLNLPAQPVVLHPFPFRRLWMRRTAFGLKLAFAIWVILFPAYGAYQQLRTFGPLAPPDPLDGLYAVQSFARDGLLDRANEDAVRWVRLGINGGRGCALQRADGHAVRYRVKIDKEKKTLLLTRRDDPDKKVEFSYSEPGAGLLRLAGTFEGGRTDVLLRKQPEAKSFLLSRGFHWINEFPLNR